MADRFYLLQNHQMGLVLSLTVIDDYSRYIVHWELCESMSAVDVKRTVDRTMEAVGLINNRPRSCCQTTVPATYPKDTYCIDQIYGKPLHPQTQGKIERYHRSMKNVVKLQNYYCPDELKAALAWFVDYLQQRMLSRIS